MKSSTSRSLAPFASCSRMLLRRSTASSALESASVWFWHTRQRSSVETCMTRFSRFSSARSGTETNARTSSSLLTLQLAHQRHDALRHDLRRDRADLLVADDALLVDHVGLGHAVHAVVDADLAVQVLERSAVRVAVALEPLQPVVALVLVVEAVERR